MNIPCENCHTNSGWTPIRAIPEFSHDSTHYPLRGMHEKVSCTGCHVKPIFTDVGKNCASCHADIHRGQFGANCAQCHTVAGWQVTLQSVSQHTNRFPLLGAHAVVQCEECHKNAAAGNYLGLSTACSSCHLTDWQQTTNPVHPSAGTAFAASNCTTCHSFDNWTNAKFDHTSTGFPLTNGHANVACALCHISNNYNLTIAPTDCGNSQCHLTTWQKTTTPVHSSSGPSFAAANCATCHTTAGWTSAAFNHSITGFTLTGTHRSPVPTPCESCHINNNYSLNSTDCYGCHQPAFQSTTTIGGAVPNHVTAGFPTTASACSTCHPITTWAAGVFNHAATGFPLTNGHANVACALCHINGNYSLTIAPTDCGNSQCHLTTWQQTNNPVHSSAGSPFAAANCATCHTTVSWTTASFNHSVTGFTLVGTHMSPTPTACAACHVNNNYTLSSTDCYGCHQAVYLGTATIGGSVPNHVAAGFPTTAAQCASCHPITTWSAGIFNHASTGFALTGMHVSPTPTPCVACHVNNSYTLNSAACYGCHVAAWQSTTTLGGAVPNHIAAGFPTDCSICHSTANWTTSTFNHSTTTFPLTGAHTAVACALCHVNGNYSGTLPTDCYSCHTVAWQSTTTLGGSVPDHIASGYPTTCASCHTTASWLGAVFNHNATGFPLTGFHVTVACTLCHISSAKPPIDCYSCHTAEWKSTPTFGGTVPNHIAASLAPGTPFLTSACSTCHTTTNWLGATFNHSAFNINHGNSGGVCATCHTNANDYTVFQCTGCHGNNNAANFHHPNVGGYVYNSVNCYACHTRG